MKVKDYFVSDLIDRVTDERAMAAKSVTIVRLARDYIDSETKNSASSYIDSKPLKAILGMLDKPENKENDHFPCMCTYKDELEEAADREKSEDEEEADE